MNEFIIENVFLFEVKKDKVLVFRIIDKDKKIKSIHFRDCVMNYIRQHYPDKAATVFSSNDDDNDNYNDADSKFVVVILNINESEIPAKEIDLRE